MSTNEFMGMLIVCIVTLLTIATAIGALIVKPIINLNKAITKLNDSIDSLNKDKENLSERVTKHGKEIDDVREHIIVHDKEIEHLKEKVK